jgi:hypothetical protein
VSLSLCQRSSFDSRLIHRIPLHQTLLALTLGDPHVFEFYMSHVAAQEPASWGCGTKGVARELSHVTA